MQFHLLTSHNPYFSRWFSAIEEESFTNYEKYTSHNPYFSRWFSAISTKLVILLPHMSHNPYFSRWFSAIKGREERS